MSKTALFKKSIWTILGLLLALTSCSLPGNISAPTATVYPTAAVIATETPQPAPPTASPPPTLPPSPTAEPTQETPNADFLNISKDAVVGNPVVINYAVKSPVELSAVEITLNSVDGELIAFDRTEDLKTETGEKIEYASPWTPNKSGEYILFLTAYDAERRAIAQDSIKITVLPLVSVEITSVSEDLIVGKTVTIQFSVDSNTDTGFSSVELTLNSVNGPYIFFDRATDLKTETEEIGYSVEWTPDKAGEYTLFLTAYDLQGQPSGSDTVNVTIAPSP